jgi:diguanylate cyclase (GGDEF)-like protein
MTATALPPRFVDYASRLPSLPGVALEVVRLAKQDWAGIDEIAAVISRDPALSAKLLKLANSPLYLRRRPATSLQDAFRVLGLKAVRMAALSFSVIDVAGAQQDFRGFDFRLFWRRSIAQAVFGKLLAKTAGRPYEDEAFTLGLLMDVAVPIQCRLGGTNYLPVVAEMSASHPDRGLELEYAGRTHDELLGVLMRDWGLPAEHAAAAAAHHDPEAIPPETPDLEFVRGLARVLAAAHWAGDFFAGTNPGGALRRLHAALDRWFDISEAKCETLLAAAAPNIETMAAVVQVDIGGSLEAEDLLGEARNQLVALSLQAHGEAESAVERARAAEHRATSDALTGLGNRAAFDATLAAAYQAARGGRTTDPFVLVIADVDRFKAFNDGFGHQAGDAVLQGVAAALRRFARSEDAVCRYGGEEFAVIATGVDLAGGRALAERLRRAVEKAEIEHEGRIHRVTASFGVAAHAGEAATGEPAALIRVADAALYRAKEAGRNRVEVAGA